MQANSTVKTLFSLFINRVDDYAIQLKDGSYTRQGQSLKAIDVLEHLAGNKTISVYQLDSENYIKWIGFDIDSFGAKNKAEILCDYLASRPVYKKAYAREPTGGRGYHVWIFFNPKIPAVVGKAIGEQILKKADITCEVFPKQTALSTSVQFGSGLRLPLGKHQKYGGMSSFEYPENIGDIKPVTMDIGIINKILAENKQAEKTNGKLSKEKSTRCPAIESMFSGVDEGARDEAAFALARFYKDMGLLQSEIKMLLAAWNSSNKIPLPESQLLKCIASAFKKGAAYSFGCKTLNKSPVLKHLCIEPKMRCGAKMFMRKQALGEEEVIPEVG